MSELHLLDILAARHGCFISDLNLTPFLTGDERDFASVKEIKVFIKQELEAE